MQARTRVSHATRGLATYLTSPANKPAVHPWAFAFRLGLSNQLAWHTVRDKFIANNRHTVARILRCAADHWQHELGELNTNTIYLLLVQMTQQQQEDLVDNLETILSPFFSTTSKTERQRYMKQSDVVPADVMSRLEMSLASLETSLLNKDPMMPQHLRNTHSILIGYPETVHLLDDAEIARIIDAAEVHTKTEIVKAAASKKTAGPKVKVSASDL